MPYTAAQLTAYYTSLTGVAPDSSTSLLFQASANQNAAGTQSDAQTLAGVFNSVGVQATFEVAESTYQFFTGATTSAAGLAYLEGTAGSGNANGLDTAYYNGTGGSITAPSTTNGFNTENRYYNFALNLATAGGPGASNFASSYGSLTFAQTVAAAYENIVGSTNVGTANANAAIADITSRMGYFQQVAATRGGDATALSNPNASLALKAVVVGYILEEANKADVGTYAKALDQFEASVAQGNAIFNTNLLSTYQAGGAGFNTGVGLTSTTGTTGQTLAFTAGTDTFNTTAGNVTFVGQVGTPAGAAGSSASIGPSDIVNAQGANNTLIVDVVGGTADASGGAILNGIQTVDVRSADGTAATLNQSAVAQATVLNSYLSTGAITFNNVSGSTTVGIVGNGTVRGGSLTAAFASGATANFALTGGVLSAATAAAGAGATTNATLTTAAPTTLNVTSSGQANSLDTLTTTGFTTVNITANQALTVNSTVDANLATLTVAGSTAVDLGGTAFANTVRSVTSTDTGGLRASFTTTGATGALNITTSATGVDRITLDAAAANTVVNTGGGGDTIQITGGAGAIAAGATLNGSGSATLAVTGADYTGLGGFTTAQRGLITGFSTLAITDALTAGTTYDANLIGAQNFTTVGTTAAAPTYAAATGTFTNGATVNAASGAIITLTGANGAAANAGIEANTGALNIALAGAATGTNDSLTLGYANQGTSVAGNQTTSTIAAQGVETIQVIANRAVGASATSSIVTTISDAVLKNITFAGNEAFFFSTDITAAAGPYGAYGQLQSVTSISTGSANIDVSTITTATAAAPITVTTGSGVDVIGVKDFARVTAGAGNDLLNVGVVTNGNTYSSFVDAAAGDRVSFANAAGINATKITLAGTALFQDYLNAATATGVANGQVSAFDFGGNTYLVENNAGGTGTGFDNGIDTVVQLVGIHTVSGTFGAAVAATATTGASLGGVVTLTS